MSGFDPAWLDLREGADHRARNRDVLAACAAHFAPRESLRVVDLGCGSGSNLRALAPHLPRRQFWRLVDNDPALLGAARARLSAWAETTQQLADDGLRLSRGGRTIDVAFARIDLARDSAAGLADGGDLVTAAALFDLVSEGWMAVLCDALLTARTPLYAVLTYNGVEVWRPADPCDAAMLAAFHAHQGRDKGFGPAAGPRAAAVLSRLLRGRGYRLDEGDSAWRLTRADAPLVEALADGVAAACAETGRVTGDVIAAWRGARHGAQVEIGHTDLFATPP